MKYIILLALEQEAPELAKQKNVYITGVGKVNAAIAVASLIQLHHPSVVINFGSAGGITVGPGLYQATKFVQRDMLCTELGVPAGVTPFEQHSQLIDYGATGLTCSTGDNFVTSSDLTSPADLVDMESYAIAKACRAMNVDFLCYKYVSDSADQDARENWENNHRHGQELYLSKLQEIILQQKDIQPSSIVNW